MLAVYLPNPPPVSGWPTSNYAELTAQAGNHWRKILVIIAKLVAKDSARWREYREAVWQGQAQLRFINSATQPSASAATQPSASAANRAQSYWQLVCGQQAQQAFCQHWQDDSALLAPNRALALQDNCLVYAECRVVFMPYLDYRQCPNALITAVRQQLFQSIEQ